MSATELSINAEESLIPLDDSAQEKRIAALKAGLSLIPVIGPLVGELISVIIPNQKTERIVTFIEVLEKKLVNLEDKFRDKIRTPEYADLLEDGMRQASRALTRERIEYIANFLKYGLTNDEIDHADEKKLLAILDALSDPEILLLKYESLSGLKRQEFMQANKNLLLKAHATLGSTQRAFDKEAFQDSYSRELQGYGLIYTRPKTAGAKATRLGKLLLRYILADDETEA